MKEIYGRFFAIVLAVSLAVMPVASVYAEEYSTDETNIETEIIPETYAETEIISETEFETETVPETAAETEVETAAEAAAETVPEAAAETETDSNQDSNPLPVPVFNSISNVNGGVRISWDPIENASRYIVMRRTADTDWEELVTTDAAVYTDEAVISGTKYDYKLLCVIEDEEGNVITVETIGRSITYVAAPSIKSLSAGNTGITINWDQSKGAAKYRVFRKKSTGGWGKLADTAALTYTDKTAAAGSEYTYTVRCLDESGNFISGYDSAGKTIIYAENPVISSISNAFGGVKIAWGQIADAAMYRVYRRTGSANWMKIADTSALTYTDQTAASGSKFYYTVRCLDESGNFISGFDSPGKAITYVAAPKLVSAANVFGGVTVKWDKVTGASIYRLYRKSGTGSWTRITDTTALTYTDKTTASGTTYIYTVRCLNGAGETISSFDSAGISAAYVAAPTLSSAENVVTGVKISWGKVSGAASYRLYRKNGSSSWGRIADTAALTYTDKTAAGGTKYSYTVRCLDESGNIISSFDPAGKSITFVAPPVLSSVSNVYGGVTVSWQKTAGASKYRLYRKSGTGTWTKIADTTALSYTDSTAVSGTRYTYTVRGLDSAGTIVSSFDAAGKSITYVAAPLVSSAEITSSGVKISWGKAAGAASYRLYRKNGSDSWARIADTTALTYTDENVTGGTKYSYTVRCLDESGNIISGFHPSGKAITYLTIPKLGNVENVNGGVKISWSKVSGAAKYRIYRKPQFGSWAKIADTAELTYTDKTARCGATYYYTVRCLDSAGNLASYFDSQGLKIMYVEAPKIQSVTNDVGAVKITWYPVNAPAHYRVYRKTAGSSWTRIGDTDEVSYRDETCTNGVKYTYTVRCIDYEGKIISSFDPTGKSIVYQRKVLNVDRTEVELSNLFGVTEITVSFLYRNGDDYVTYQVESPKLVTCEWGVEGWDGYDIPLRITAGHAAGTTYITLKNSINSETIRIKVTVVDDMIHVTSGN